MLHMFMHVNLCRHPLCAQEVLDGSLIASRLERAVSLRSRLFPDPSLTSGYRLINGEGDGLPGLHCDVYDSVAVMKLDGQGPQGFYDEQVTGHKRDGLHTYVDHSWLPWKGTTTQVQPSDSELSWHARQLSGFRPIHYRGCLHQVT
jgi:hypothetical protein